MQFKLIYVGLVKQIQKGKDHLIKKAFEPTELCLPGYLLCFAACCTWAVEFHLQAPALIFKSLFASSSELTLCAFL